MTENRAALHKLIADTAADLSAQKELWTAGDLADALIATGKLVLIDDGTVEAGIGPRTLPGKQTCKGCPALHTEDWREFIYEDDEWDSGTYGTCTAVPEGERGHSLGSYWSPTSPVPDWCPATAAISALGVK